MIMITTASCKHNDHDISTFILNKASNYKGRSESYWSINQFSEGDRKPFFLVLTSTNLSLSDNVQAKT